MSVLSGTAHGEDEASVRRTVHLVYPHGEGDSPSDSVGREMGVRLESRYDVVYHDWDSRERIEPRAGDVLIGWPHPDAGTCFKASLGSSQWGRKIVLCPFADDPAQVGYLDRVMPHVDAFLAITGSYWFAAIEQSSFAHWRPRMVQVHMAIDAASFPRIKTRFNPAGSRRLVYIGESGPRWNTDYLARLAGLAPEVHFDWIGGGAGEIPGLGRLGSTNLSTPEGRRTVADHDFLITVGRRDAYANTVLEAMCWGLIPVCTPQSGYYHNPGVMNVSADDPESALRVIRALNHVDEAWLLQVQRQNRDQIAGHYNWDRFAAQVAAEIESTGARPLGRESALDRLRLRRSAIASSSD